MYVTHDQVEAMTMGHRIAVMSEGVLQQIGTPQDVYSRPSNVFVATFLGAPPMNLIDGALDSVDGGGWRFRGAGRRRAALHGGAEHARAGARDRGEERGQARPAPGAHPPRRARSRTAGSPAVVRFLEPVGSDLYLTVEAGGTIVQVRTDPDAAVQPDENVTLHFDAGRVHVFGADGHNLRRDAGRVESPAALIQAAS